MSRLAYSLVTLRSQINAAFPGRSKAADGWIGDEAHSARTSDHNPGADGVVEAIDVTHDPKHFDAHKWAREVLVKSGDKRLKYVISNGQIWSAEKASQGWRQYGGANKHTQHIHVSVVNSLMDEDDLWQISAKRALRLIVNGKEVAGAFKTDEGTTVVPVRALSEAIGFTVDFDPKTNTVTVKKS